MGILLYQQVINNCKLDVFSKKIDRGLVLVKKSVQNYSLPDPDTQGRTV